MTLDEMLALLPDNATGAIDAADLRAIVTGLWDHGAGVAARVAALEGAGPGDGGPSVTGFWQINPQAGSAPGGRQATFSSAQISAATWIRFDPTDQTDTDLTAALLSAGTVYVQQRADAGNWARFTATGPAVDAGGYVEVPVVFEDGAGSLASAGWQAGAFVLRVAP